MVEIFAQDLILIDYWVHFTVKTPIQKTSFKKTESNVQEGFLKDTVFY